MLETVKFDKVSPILLSGNIVESEFPLIFCTGSKHYQLISRIGKYLDAKKSSTVLKDHTTSVS